MMQKYFGKFAKELNVPFEELFSFGHTRLNPDEPLQYDYPGVTSQSAREWRQ